MLWHDKSLRISWGYCCRIGGSQSGLHNARDCRSCRETIYFTTFSGLDLKSQGLSAMIQRSI